MKGLPHMLHNLFMGVLRMDGSMVSLKELHQAGPTSSNSEDTDTETGNKHINL